MQQWHGLIRITTHTALTYTERQAMAVTPPCGKKFEMEPFCPVTCQQPKVCVCASNRLTIVAR